jgi:hypothetical protein
LRSLSENKEWLDAHTFFLIREPIKATVWNTPVFIIATVFFVVDGVFSHLTQLLLALFSMTFLTSDVPFSGNWDINQGRTDVRVCTKAAI